MTGSTAATANIILTGFMGTGKSTVGRIIADRLELPFVDTDALIEHRYGPIAAIFAEWGEERFREIERELVRWLAERPGPIVIATGGGMLVDPENAALLSATGVVYTLFATPEEIVSRVADGPHNRPLLAGPSPARRVEELLRDRAPIYARWTQVPTGDRSAEAVADLVLADAVERGVVESGDRSS